MFQQQQSVFRHRDTRTLERDLVGHDAPLEADAPVGLKQVGPLHRSLPHELRPLRVPGPVVTEDGGHHHELAARRDARDQRVEGGPRLRGVEPVNHVAPVEHLRIRRRSERRREARCAPEVVPEERHLLGLGGDHELARLDRAHECRAHLARVLLVVLQRVSAPEKEHRDECERTEASCADEAAGCEHNERSEHEREVARRPRGRDLRRSPRERDRHGRENGEREHDQARGDAQTQYGRVRGDNAGWFNNGFLANNRLAQGLGMADTFTNPAAEQEIYRLARENSTDGNVTPQTLAAAREQVRAGWGAQNDPNGAFLQKKFGADDLANDTVYQNGMRTAMEEGNRGIENQQAASGSLLSGATLKALARFGADTGNKFAGQAYDRFTGKQNQLYSQYSGVSGAGQAAAGGNASAGANMVNTTTAAGANMVNATSAAGNNSANQISGNQTGLGNARGASQIAQGNALGSGLTGAYGNYQQNRLLSDHLDRMRGTNPTGNTIYNGSNSPWGSNDSFFYGNRGSGD